MNIGIPKEIKPNENRFPLVPAGAAALISAGHTVIVETGAGLGSDFNDAQYLAAGAQIAKDAEGTAERSQHHRRKYNAQESCRGIRAEASPCGILDRMNRTARPGCFPNTGHRSC